MSEPAKQERKNLFQRRRRGSETAKKKSEKKASSKIAFRRPYQSTQFVLPIKDFYKGKTTIRIGRKRINYSDFTRCYGRKD